MLIPVASDVLGRMRHGHNRIRENRLAYVLLALTAATGIVDAVSFLGLGHIFTANMTGNVVFMGFAPAGAPELSFTRLALVLLAFLSGAVILTAADASVVED